MISASFMMLSIFTESAVHSVLGTRRSCVGYAGALKARLLAISTANAKAVALLRDLPLHADITL